MTAILIAAAVGFFVTLLGTPVAIRLFRLWGWGQRIREDGPKGHMEKMGTPTMGGVVIIGGMVAAYIAARLGFGGSFTAGGLAVLGLTLGLGAVGAADDLIKIRRRRSLGLGKTAKLLCQLVAAVVFAVVVLHGAHLTSDLTFIRDTGLKLGIVFYLWVFVMVAASANGVNLTDGLDGLAGGVLIFSFVAYLLIALVAVPDVKNSQPNLAVFCALLIGALMGFLWFNVHPAQLFMGDSGALGLGATLAVVATISGQLLLLVIIGAVFVAVTLSVVLQVGSFKLRGRRIFRMAPLQHHFELIGWAEEKITVRFWIVSALAGLLGFSLFLASVNGL